MKKIRKVFASNAVFFISLAAALISMIFVPPGRGYIDYIDFDVLIMLFCLMGVVAAFRSIGIFTIITDFLLKHTVSSRMIAFILMNLCFFTSMIITNDVALMTFVPLSMGIAACTSDKDFLIKTVVIETAAANLGSMMTPIGNPHNLFIYSYYNISAADFVTTLLPLGILSYGLLCLSILLIKKGKIPYTEKERKPFPKMFLLIYSLLFLVCIFAVSGLVSKYACLLITVAALAVCSWKVFLRIDYMLLATFVCFFIFVGNLGHIDSVSSFISGILKGREILVSALLSQIISNVPATVMLSGFTSSAVLLLAGVNIGGLGTPVASLASLISYRLYSASEKPQTGRYMGFFLIYNFAFFALLLGTELIIQKI
ncbi:MAG: SLC13 family permease [Porcipelethomonas sp.]